MQYDTPSPVRLILDTNVVLDLLHFTDVGVLPILQALDDRRAQCYASINTLAELRRVLAYPEFKLDEIAQDALFTRYQAWVGVVEAASTHVTLPRCRDPDDQMFLQLAASVHADYLVSKDKALLVLKHHHGLEFKILTPTEAAALFAV
ncbi:MAG: putative toxin-antitoxin system toxin component, PIN family [Thiobacillaceae bacterium]